MPVLVNKLLGTHRLRLGALEFRFHWLIAACVAMTVIGLVRLGLWQLDRAREKLDLHESYEAMQAQQPADIRHLPLAGIEYDARQLQSRLIRLDGRFMNDRTIYLIYQPYEEQLGYEVVTPFMTSDDTEIVMVSRGWSALQTYEELNEKLPIIEGETTLMGQIFVPTPAMAARSSQLPSTLRWPLVTRYLNIEEISQLFDLPVFPYIVRLGQGEPGVLIRHWPAVLVDMDRNFSYALQWFAMAIAVVIVSLVLSSNLLQVLQQRSRPL